VFKILQRIQSHTVEIVVKINSRITHHQEVITSKVHQKTVQEQSLFSRVFQSSYFKAYVQGCEESRRVNYAQGYMDGFRNGKILGRIQVCVTAIVFSKINGYFSSK
jgi:hypothetical protein